MKKILVAMLLSLIAISAVNAQLTATAQVGVTVTVSSVNSITLTESGGSLTFDPTTGATNTVTFSTTYNLDGTNNNIKLYSWFSSPAAALATSTNNNISSSQVAATFNNSVSSGSGTPCNQAPGIGTGVVDGGACQAALLISQGSNGGAFTSSGGGGIVTTYSLAILNYGPSLRLAAGSYTGVLNVMAFAS